MSCACKSVHALSDDLANTPDGCNSALTLVWGKALQLARCPGHPPYTHTHAPLHMPSPPDASPCVQAHPWVQWVGVWWGSASLCPHWF